MAFEQLIDEYVAGTHKLREAVQGMTRAQLVARPVPGKWSTLEVVCHIADFEPVYADRIKRTLVEDEPTVFGGDPDRFAARLAYHSRDLEEELSLIEAVRRHVARILRTVPPEDFARRCRHNQRGLLTLQQLLRSVTEHIPHHIRFIAEKRQALGV